MKTGMLMYQKFKHVGIMGAVLSSWMPGPVPAMEVEGLEKAVQEWAGDRPGAIVALAIEGADRGFVAAGQWSPSSDKLADENTAFEIGSITKVFSSLLAADAVAAGVLLWEDRVGAPFDGSDITYAELSTHMAGLPRLPRDFPAAGLTDPYAGIDRAALVKSWELETETEEAASREWAYSNFGAAVLGQSVASAWGGNYHDELRHRVLDRLGMDQTWLSGLGKQGALEVAPGHNAEGVAAAWRFDAYAPAGALVSSASQMERFMRAMLDPEAAGLPRTWGETMTARVQLPREGAMGFGWFIAEVGGTPVYWHGGGTGGYRSFVGVQPATGRGIVVMGARDQAVEGIGLGWLQGLLNDGEPAATVADLNDYVGDYPLMPSFIIAVTVVEGKLYLQATRQPRLGLVAAGDDRFNLEGVTAAVSFDRDDSGEVVGLVLHQHGADRPAKRFPLGSQQPSRKNIAMTAEQLAPLVGEYALAPTFRITISQNGTMLFAQATGQQKFPIFASASDVFFYEVVEAEIHFERNAEGDVTGLVLHQGGQKLPGAKLK